MRTYTRADLEEARALWADFSAEWAPYRKLAADGGLLFPPGGTKWDSWDDDHPSQRALLIRAIRETPEATKRAIIVAPSWAVVIRRLLHERDDELEMAVLAERDVEFERGRFTDSQAMRRISEIVAVIRDSV